MEIPTHPLVIVGNELSRQFVRNYSEYTGVGASYKIAMSA
jgi:hypothetical protein